jgi:predicted nucleic acid-binding protein
MVSGDQDLLVLDEYEGIQVVTPRRFVEILERSNEPQGEKKTTPA